LPFPEGHEGIPTEYPNGKSENGENQVHFRLGVDLIFTFYSFLFDVTSTFPQLPDGFSPDVHNPVLIPTVPSNLQNNHKYREPFQKDLQLFSVP
jgi:hypothetical protein